jgi:hypothetical protein
MSDTAYARFNSVSRDCASKAPGPSLATGMSRDPANVGGEHEEVAELLENTDRWKAAGALETTSLTASAAIFDDKHTGTAPGAGRPDCDCLGSPNSSLSLVASSDMRPAALASLPDGAAGSSFDPGPCVGALLANSSMAFLSLAFTATSEKRTQVSSSSDISNHQQ